MNDYTEEQVRELQRHTEEYFALLARYINKCRKVDPALRCEEVDPDDMPLDCFEFGGNNILFRYEEDFGRSGCDQHLEKFPLSDLWAPDWGELRRCKIQERERQAQEAALALECKERKRRQDALVTRELHERAELERLRAKYEGAA